MRSPTPLLILALAGLGASLSAVEIDLRAPLTTLVPQRQPLAADQTAIEAEVTVPADAPPDLGVGAYVNDQHGRWFQIAQPGVLGPGQHTLRIAIGAAAELRGEPWPAGWSPASAATMRRGGLYFWSASGSRAHLVVTGAAFAPGTTPARAATSTASTAPAAPPPGRILDLRLDGQGEGGCAATTGVRWSLGLRPAPFPANPDDPAQFHVDLLVTAPDGKEARVPGFWYEPVRLSDRGDRELAAIAGPGEFRVRFRPRQPGTHRLVLVAQWAGGNEQRTALPPLIVGGPPWDGYVRTDAKDPRFWSVDGAWWWALGPNLRSVNDTRGRERLHTRLTPDRGTAAYDAYLTRLAANGVTAVEIWMSSWNLALEWRADWQGFYGLGRYNQGNAARLDRILDRCSELGIRVNLVINNHGQATVNNDPEWADNPVNRTQGGPLVEPWQVFTDPAALAAQERLRRYVVARYADHPAILGWKLWSEVNLTAGRPGALRDWHAQAVSRWHELDTYHHGVTTHWSGDYHVPDRVILAQAGLDYLCIDAYHGEDRLLADLIQASVLDPYRGLGQYGKPVLTTEFGGNWDACPAEQLVAEHASAPWAGLVSGQAGSPMIWWFEWLDQRDAFAPYRAVSSFIRGEDPRGDGRSIALAATSAGGALWARGWVRPGRLLGYVLDSAWGANGLGEANHPAAEVVVGGAISPGSITVEWWDAGRGGLLSSQRIDHPGGDLHLHPPVFARHIAFKMLRVAAAGAASVK